MKPSEKLLKAFEKFEPHLTGHKTAMNLFFEAIEEVKRIEKCHNVSSRDGSKKNPYIYKTDICPYKEIRFCSNPGSSQGCQSCRVFSGGF